MKIVFFGTPEYVLPILELVHLRFSRRGVSPIVAVVTQPPRPSGREQRVTYSPIDSWAFKKRVPIFHNSRDFVSSNTPADLGILAAYGEIVPKEVIGYFPFGILNVHPSLLPKWRGASPVQAPIIAGEKETGVSIIKLDEKLDHGPIVSQFKEDISDSDTTETLRARLFERSATVLVELLEAYLNKKIKPREQNHKEATFTTQIKKQDAFIPPNLIANAMSVESSKKKVESMEIKFVKDCILPATSYMLHNFIRAMYPWPVAWTTVMINGQGSMVNNTLRVKRLKILESHLDELTINHQPLVIDQVQLEGKSPVSWKQFKEAYREAVFAEA